MFGTGAKRVVIRIGRNIIRQKNLDQLSFLPQEVDDLADQIAPDMEPSEDFLVFRQDFLADQLNEIRFLQPIAKQGCARIPNRPSGFEPGNASDQYTGIDSTSTLIFSNRQR